ncbi:MAG: hypothetical protein HN849_29970 [Victivallales bacterium]|nr:hypothetical protein [Victivallales bacterium]
MGGGPAYFLAIQAAKQRRRQWHSTRRKPADRRSWTFQAAATGKKDAF